MSKRRRVIQSSTLWYYDTEKHYTADDSCCVIKHSVCGAPRAANDQENAHAEGNLSRVSDGNLVSEDGMKVY